MMEGKGIRECERGLGKRRKIGLKLFCSTENKQQASVHIYSESESESAEAMVWCRISIECSLNVGVAVSYYINHGNVLDFPASLNELNSMEK